MACYRNLMPDPNSAPALRQNSITPPIEDSKSQAKKIEHLTKKFIARLNAKKRAKTAQRLLNPEKTVDKDAKKKDRYYVLTQTDFKNDIWSK
jgi:hypothetical protein